MRDKMTVADAMGPELDAAGSGPKPQREGGPASTVPLGAPLFEPAAACVLPVPVEPLPPLEPLAPAPACVRSEASRPPQPPVPAPSSPAMATASSTQPERRCPRNMFHLLFGLMHHASGASGNQSSARRRSSRAGRTPRALARPEATTLPRAGTRPPRLARPRSSFGTMPSHEPRGALRREHHRESASRANRAAPAPP